MKAVNLSLPSIGEIAESIRNIKSPFGSGMKNWPHFVTGTLPPIGWIKSVKILINGLIINRFCRTTIFLPRHIWPPLSLCLGCLVAYP